MAATDPKSSFLGSISPWSTPQSTTPIPGEERADRKGQDHLTKSSGRDHTPSNRPLPSPRRYPADCPSLRTRWFYAVDVPKRKPLVPDPNTDDVGKAQTIPKKFTAFSATDSTSIENAFQKLADCDSGDRHTGEDASPKSTRVPVNEDYLFDVTIETRELEPAYWLGPVYEVRRGSWFYPEGSKLRPCEENLANQLEEGYLKIAPWRFEARVSARSTNQPRRDPASGGPEKTTLPPSESNGTSPIAVESPKVSATESKKSQPVQNTYRLFGSHMNTTVTYQDINTAWLVTDDFISRMSSTFSGYRGLGAFSGTKVVRGYASSSGPQASEKPKASGTATTGSRRASTPPKPSAKEEAKADGTDSAEDEATTVSDRSALERQLSSIVGAPGNENSTDVAEEARQQEEKEMENYKEHEGDDQGRRIDHLVLVTHGIGQRLGQRLESINFIHDVNTLRKTMKMVYAGSPDLQALNSEFRDQSKNSRVLTLPIQWRHLLDFPKQSVRDKQKEADLGNAETVSDDDYPSLADITVDGVPAVRNLISDLAIDILLYQSRYRRHIASIVQQECNRVYNLFKRRNPDFAGRVSLCGHSLGSAILFDILSRQKDTPPPPLQNSDKREKDLDGQKSDLQLDFECEHFFALGSPIALYCMLEGRTIAARRQDEEHVSEHHFDLDPMASPAEGCRTAHAPPNRVPAHVSSPKCDEFFNIFHPTDPISYRIEPLISPAMAALKPQLLPYTKRGLFGAPGIGNIGARVGQSVGSLWSNFTSGVASSLLNRSLGITGEEQALTSGNKFQGSLLTEKKNQQQTASGAQMAAADSKRQQDLAEATLSSTEKSGDHMPTLIDSELETLYAGFQKRRLSQQTNSPGRPKAELDEAEEKAKKLKREEGKVKALNSNGRVDYSIREGAFDISLLASIASHLSYWGDLDVNHFMISQMLRKARHEKQG